MSQPTVNARDLGPIRASDGQRVCSLAGINSAQAKIVTLTQLQASLQLTITELESERKKEKIVEKAYMVARVTKATCDAFIEMAATLAAFVPGAKNEAEKIANLYGAATPLAQAGMSTALGQAKSVDWAGTVATSGKKFVGAATKNEGYRLLADGGAAKIEVIKNAMNQDKKALVKTAASYIYDLNATVADLAKWEKTSAGAKIMKSAFEYNQQLDETLTDMIGVMDESEQRFMGLKNNLLAQGKRISKLIDDLEDYVASCTDRLTAADANGRA